MGPISDGEQSPEREEPQKKRWGAIATTDGSMGVAEDEESEEDAKRKALEQCEASSSGKACEVRVAYYNQCVAVAWGDGGSRTTRGPELKEAEAGAMKLCQRTTTNCDLYYSACSYADEVAQ